MTNLEYAESLVRHIYDNSNPSPLEILKANAMRVAAEHRDKCAGAECNVSLSLLREVAERAGITFSADEQQLFL